MSGSHEKLPWLFWAQLALAGIILILYLMAPAPEKHGESEHAVSESSKQTLKPVGEVAIASADGAPGEGSERTGKEIVEKTCQSCHAHGVANAPKMDDSAKAAWESRLANGMQGLIKVAKAGKGAMPAMGTDPTLSDAELKNAIAYMLEKAGVDVPTDADTTTDAAASPKDESIVESTSEVSVAKAESSAPPEQPAEPKAPKSPAAPEEGTSVIATAPEPSAAPEPAKAPELSAAPEPSVAPEPAEKVAEASAPEIPAAPEQPAAAVATTAASTDSSAKGAIDGKEIYQSSCFSCHATGVAGSPKVADKGAWVSRIAAGVDALYESAIKGKGVMPPKGGNMSLSDDQIKAVVDYMVSQSQ